jgi:hypothetical protein
MAQWTPTRLLNAPTCHARMEPITQRIHLENWSEQQKYYVRMHRPELIKVTKETANLKPWLKVPNKLF